MHIKGGATVEALKPFFPKTHEELVYERLKMVDDVEDKVMKAKQEKKKLNKCPTLNRGKMEHFEPGTGINLIDYPVKKNYT